MFQPTNISELIGLENVKQRIEIAVAAAKSEKRPIRHTILHGPPGTGKTTIGHIMSNMMESDVIYTVGNGLNITKELNKIKVNDILFIDEIHTLKKEEEEKLYLPMTDFQYIDASGLYDIPLPIAPFTLIGATTLIGKVSKPLVDRFPIQFALGLYTIEELYQIIEQMVKKEGILVDQDAISKIALASRDTPRVALTLLTNIVEFLLYRKQYTITTEMVEAVFNLMGIQSEGLTDGDIQYMDLLFEANRPLGVRAIAATMLTDIRTVMDFIEPFLLRKGYVAITGGGRILLRKGLEVVTRARS